MRFENVSFDEKTQSGYGYVSPHIQGPFGAGESNEAKTDTSAALQRALPAHSNLLNLSQTNKGCRAQWCVDTSQRSPNHQTRNRIQTGDGQGNGPQSHAPLTSCEDDPSTDIHGTSKRRIQMAEESRQNLIRMAQNEQAGPTRDVVPILRASDSERRQIFAPALNGAHLFKSGTTTRSTVEDIIVSDTTHQHQQLIQSTIMRRPVRDEFSIYDVGTFEDVAGSKPKSDCIMIKPSRTSHHDEFHHAENSSERMYDWATWRMYHRITQARQSRAAVVPVNYSTGLGGNHVIPCSPTVQTKPLTNVPLPQAQQQQPNLSALDYSLDGEVFQIDL